MPYHVYFTTHRLEHPHRKLSKRFETAEAAERYYCELVNDGQLDGCPLLLVLEKTAPRNVLKRHDFSKGVASDA